MSKWHIVWFTFSLTLFEFRIKCAFKWVHTSTHWLSSSWNGPSDGFRVNLFKFQPLYPKTDASDLYVQSISYVTTCLHSFHISNFNLWILNWTPSIQHTYKAFPMWSLVCIRSIFNFCILKRTPATQHMSAYKAFPVINHLHLLIQSFRAPYDETTVNPGL